MKVAGSAGPYKEAILPFWGWAVQSCLVGLSFSGRTQQLQE